MTKGMGYPRGFQAEPLNKPECEVVATSLRSYYATHELAFHDHADLAHIRRRINTILVKLGMAEICEDATT